MNRLVQTAIGASVLAEWLGSGNPPVTPMVADKRARACTSGCAGAECPKNWRGDWWNRLTAEVAVAVMDRQRARFALQLTNRYDGDLHFCNACGCDLKTKVWTPIDHILHHTPQSLIDELPDWCWIKKEANPHEPPTNPP